MHGIFTLFPIDYSVCYCLQNRSHFRYVDRIGNGINVVFGIVGNSLSLLTLCRKNMLKNVSTTYFIGLGEYLCGYTCFIETHFVLNKSMLNSVADLGFLRRCVNPKGGTQPNIRPNIHENCMKIKKSGPRWWELL